MPRPAPFRLLLLLAAAGVLGACEAPADPEPGVPESALTFVRMAPDAPPLETLDTAFWAVRGEDREVQVRYVSPTYGFGKCLRFIVPAGAIPAGAVPGDSVRIRIRVADAQRFEFEFEPSGLRFDPAHPARIEVRFSYADPDYNGDGVVDASDAGMEARTALWHQATPGGLWDRLETQRTSDGLEARADVVGFSQYALATD